MGWTQNMIDVFTVPARTPEEAQARADALYLSQRRRTQRVVLAQALSAEDKDTVLRMLDVLDVGTGEGGGEGGMGAEGAEVAGLAQGGRQGGNE